MNKYNYWIALSEAPGIGIASMKEIYKSLLSTGLSIQDIMELTESEIEDEFSFSKRTVQGILKGQQLLENTEDVYQQILTAGIEPVLFFEENYPEQLKNSNSINTPPLLYCFGNKRNLQLPLITVMSGAEISSTADTIAYHTGKILAEHGICAGTGLNRGAGTLFASGTLENRGELLAIIPCGLLTFNMSDNLKEIFDPDTCTIVSPFFPKEEISKHNAIYRNELLSELSDAIYIIEMKKDDPVITPTVKHISKISTPLYATHYSEYPEEASGNQNLFENYGALPIRGKKVGNIIQPNLDAIMAHAKFSKKTKEAN